MKIALSLILLVLTMTAYKIVEKSPLSYSSSRSPSSIPANLEVPAGNKLFAHVYARGVQIYRCTQDQADTNRFAWIFIAPDADLYAQRGYRRKTGRHYAGPTWESMDGSKVVGVKLQQANSPDPTAVPWLLLRSASTSGAGIFDRTSFIQRLYTVGGKAPATGADRAHKGAEIRVSYTAEYLFYRALKTSNP